MLKSNFKKQTLYIIINFDNCNFIYFAFKFTFRYPSFLQVKLKPINVFENGKVF